MIALNANGPPLPTHLYKCVGSGGHSFSASSKEEPVGMDEDVEATRDGGTATYAFITVVVKAAI